VSRLTPATILYTRTSRLRRSDGSVGVYGHRAVATASRARFVFTKLGGYTARAVIGVPTDDQTVDVRARATTLRASAAAIDGSASWRYVDDSNCTTDTAIRIGVAAQALQRRHRTQYCPLRSVSGTDCASSGGRQIRGFVNGSSSPKPPIPRTHAARRAPLPIAPPWISTTITPSSPDPSRAR
jgi:hypothetical protein